ncbi:MAG: hypothetical protein QM731_09420 [Chitinophagaceae bacterium]
MDNMTEQNRSDESMFDLQVDHHTGRNFISASKWAAFVAIVYFVGIGLALLVLFFAGNMIVKNLAPLMPETQELGSSALISALVFVLLFFLFINTFLYRFAKQVRKGIEQQDQHSFNEGLRALKNYFMVCGIIAIIGFALNALNIVGSSFN